MAEEAKKEIEYTDTEQKAMDEGWIPPDRFDKAEKDGKFKTAEEYLEYGSFFKKISTQNKEIQELRSTVSGITEHQKKVTQMELDNQKQQYEQTIADLKVQKVQALDEGNHEQVVDIDEKIRTTPQPTDPKPDNSIWDGWVKENQWYSDDKFLQREATSIGEQIAKDEGLFGRELFDEVSSHIKQKYPSKFDNANRQNPATVEGGSNLPANSSKIASDKDLTPDERTVYKKWDRQGVFKDDDARKKYFAEVISVRD